MKKRKSKGNESFFFSYITLVSIVNCKKSEKPNIAYYVCERGPTGPTGPQGLTGPTGPQGLSRIESASFFSRDGGLEPGSFITLRELYNHTTNISFENNQLTIEGPGIYFIDHVLTADIAANDYIRIAPFVNGIPQDFYLTYANTGATTKETTTSGSFLYRFVNDEKYTIQYEFNSNNPSRSLNFILSIIRIE